MTTLLPLLVIAALAALALPFWPWSRGWGWAPFGILAIGLATLLLFRFSVVPEA